MIRSFISCAVLLWAVAANSLPSVAQEISTGSDSREEYIPAKLEAAWAAYRMALDRGADAEALNALGVLNDRAKSLGIENAEALSTAVLRDAGAAYGKGKKDFALDLGLKAQAISPDFPASYYYRGRIFLKSDFFNFLELFNEYSRGWYQTSRHLWSILFTIEAGTFWVLVTGLMAFLVFIFSLVLRYTPRISHLIFELANKNLHNLIIHFFIAVLLIGPLWLGLGLVWAIIWWLVIFWVFMTLQERMIALLFVLVTATAGIWIPAWISVGEVKESADFRVIAKAVGGEPGLPSRIENLAEHQSMREDGMLTLARGLQYRRSGLYDLAKMEFTMALDVLPGDERVFINLGNISFLENNIRKAMEYYEKAIDINPKSVEAQYNLAQAYRENLAFEEGETHYQEAKRLDLKRTEIYTSRSAIEDGLPVVDASIGLSEALVKALLFRTHDIERKSDELFTLLWSSSISSAPLIGLLFGAILMLLSPRGYIKRLSFQCALCGRMICNACQKHIFHLRVCHSCSEKNKQVRRFSELRQLQQRRDREMRIARVVSVLVPGTGHLYLMYSIRGFILAFIFAALVIWFFAEGLPFYVPYAWMLSENRGDVFVLGGGLLILYAVVFWDLARLQDLLGEEELWH